MCLRKGESGVGWTTQTEGLEHGDGLKGGERILLEARMTCPWLGLSATSQKDCIRGFSESVNGETVLILHFSPCSPTPK